MPLRNAQDERVISFLEYHIFSRFGLPLKIILDNGPDFIFANLTWLLSNFSVKHFTSSAYYPQGMGRMSQLTRI